MWKEEIPSHKKEFPVTEENGSRKKEIYLKGNTIIIGEIFLSQENISCGNNKIMLPGTNFL